MAPELKHIMSTEKTHDEVQHDITAADVQYPIVVEGTGKTLDRAQGAKEKEVHNVSPFIIFLPTIPLRLRPLA